MKSRTWVQPLFFMFIMMFILPSAFAQSDQEMPDRQRFETKRREAMQIVGMELRDQTGNDIGEVDNVIVTPDERVFAVLSIGGFWGFFQERVLVPIEELRLSGDDYVVYPGTQEDLEALPTFRDGRSRQYIHRNYRAEGEISEQERRESAETTGRQRRQAQTDERRQESREGGRMTSTLTFPAPEGKGAIVLERDGLQQVRVGQTYDYTLQVSNESDYPVHEVTIKEILSDNIAVDESKAQGRKQDPQQKDKDAGIWVPVSEDVVEFQEEGKNKWTLGTLMPGETKRIEVSGVAQAIGAAKSCLVVDFKPSLCNEFQVVEPELQLERNFVDAEGNPIEEAYACDEIYMVYKLTNSGTGTTRKATIKEEFPESLKVDEDKDKVNLTVQKLDSGETVERRVSIKAGEQARYEGRATAATDKLEVNSETSSIVIMKPELDVSIDGPQEEYLGRPIQYHVRVENTSDAPALDTVVTLNSGDSLKNMSVSRQQMERNGNEFMIGKLEAGESREFSVTFDADQPGKITNTVIAKAYCAAEKSHEITTDIRGIAAVRLSVIDRTDPVKVGDTTIYEISVKNQGSAEDMNVSLKGTLPKEMEFVSGEGDTNVTGNGQNVQFVSVESLPPGEVFSWNVKARATETGRTRFRLELTSDANPRPIISMEPTTIF